MTRRLLPLLALAVVVVPAVALALTGGVDVARLAGQSDWLIAAAARLGPAGPLLYAIAYAAIAGLSLPLTAPMSIFAGFLFGRAVGLAAAVGGATVGAGIVFRLASTAFGETWRRRAGPRLLRFEAGFRADSFFYLLTLRLLPVFPFWLVNFAAAFLGVPLRAFLAATAIGIVPANIVFVSLGAGLGGVIQRHEQPDVAILLTPAILLPLAALALLALAPVAYRLWRRNRAKRSERVTETIRCDICIIGGGPAGRAVAMAAAQLGAATVLVERGAMTGGTGIAATALLAAAKAAQAVRRAPEFGIAAAPPTIDFAAVMRSVDETIAALAPLDTAQRVAGLGVRVLRTTARFTGPHEILAGETSIRARRFVIATGSRPAIPALIGLDTVPYLTRATFLGDRVLPQHLVILGGASVAFEMAQAYARLGSRVTLLDGGVALPEDDPELVELLCQRLAAEGVAIRRGGAATDIRRDGDGIAIVAGGERLAASHLLVAGGDVPEVESLDLAAAGIACGPTGIAVDAGLRTANRRIYAIGSVTGARDAAAYHAGIVLRRALFRRPATVDDRARSWATLTDPELAQCGMTEAAARTRHGGDIRILRASFHESERAVAERSPHGMVKIVTRRDGSILGAAILAAGAGELIQPWVLALAEGLKIKSLAGLRSPVPTLGETSKRAAVAYFLPQLLAERTRTIVALLARLG